MSPPPPPPRATELGQGDELGLPPGPAPVLPETKSLPDIPVYRWGDRPQPAKGLQARDPGATLSPGPWEPTDRRGPTFLLTSSSPGGLSATEAGAPEQVADPRVSWPPAVPGATWIPGRKRDRATGTQTQGSGSACWTPSCDALRGCLARTLVGKEERLTPPTTPSPPGAKRGGTLSQIPPHPRAPSTCFSGVTGLL